MRRSLAFLGVSTVLLASCAAEPTAPTPRPSASPPTAASPEPIPSPEPSADPQPVPGTMPTTYGPDVLAQDVPPEVLIPVGATPTGEWFAFTDEGVMIAVAWAEPGGDITELPRGVAVWRRAAVTPHWHLAWVRRRGAGAALTEVQVTAADVTADGSDDVLLFEGTSGSGGCGSWFVVELLSVERIFRKDLCDGRIEPAAQGSSGLILTESIYRPGDAHCCPSAIRRTLLVWSGTGWEVAERTRTEM